MKSSTLLLTMLLFFALSCRKEQFDDCFTSYGKDGVERRILKDFSRLEVGDNFDLTFIEDTGGTPYIELRGGKNMFPGIETAVEGHTLSIKNRNVCNFVRDYKKRIALWVYAPSLNDLSVTASTNIFCRDTLHLNYLNIYQAALSDITLKLDLDELYVNSINSGSITLEGKARVMKGSIEEISNLNALNFRCEEVLLDNHSVWDCYINASKLIYARIYNQGNIYYPSDPSDFAELNEQKGSGKLIRLN